MSATEAVLPQLVPEAYPVDKLGFVLPDFTRSVWVSERARSTWAPRIRRICAIWSELEWRTVENRLRRCALKRIAPAAWVLQSAQWTAAGLVALPLAMEGPTRLPYASKPAAYKGTGPFEFSVAVGKFEDAAAFQKAWEAGAHDAMGALLGFPRCCREFFQKVWIEDQCVDTTWQMAANSGIRREQRLLEASGPPEANILWRWMGVRMVPHLPCSFDCPGTIALARGFAELGEGLGFTEEIGWVKEILSWPVEWSALHGIAEIKTPVVKVSCRTDATAHKYTVRKPGTQYPEEGAQGVGFPYRPPGHIPVSASRGFQAGLANLIQIKVPQPEWYHRDNGFQTRHAMERLHAPIVTLAAEALGAGGSVVDLGCGNGALLRTIAERYHKVVPYGVDLSDRSLAHARSLTPNYAVNFRRANLFDCNAWALEEHYSLVILMIGRMLENPKAGEQLLRIMKERCDHLLVYAYPGWSRDPLPKLVHQTGLQLLRTNGDTAALVC